MSLRLWHRNIKVGISQVKTMEGERLKFTSSLTCIRRICAFVFVADLHRDIHTKLVSIMRDTVMSYVSQMRGMVVEWGAFPEKLSPYVVGLSDKTQTLFRLLQKILQHDQLERLFDDIMAMYCEQLAQTYRSLDLPTRNARLRLANDVRELCARLKSFEGIRSTIGLKLVEEFGTAPPPPPPINIDI